MDMPATLNKINSLKKEVFNYFESKITDISIEDCTSNIDEWDFGLGKIEYRFNKPEGGFHRSFKDIYKGCIYSKGRYTMVICVPKTGGKVAMIFKNSAKSNFLGE